jgi:hypothetical protein
LKIAASAASFSSSVSKEGGVEGLEFRSVVWKVRELRVEWYGVLPAEVRWKRGDGDDGTSWTTVAEFELELAT